MRMLHLDFEYVTALVSRNKLLFGAMPALQDHGYPCGLRISLCTLHLSCSFDCLKCPSNGKLIAIPTNSATGATRDTGGWLALSRQGLSPCKVHQASLGALTISMCCRGARSVPEVRASISERTPCTG